MKKILSTGFMIALLFSCNESASTNNEINSADTTTTIATNTTSKVINIGCYGFHQNGDDINFNITSVNDSVIGDLKYELAEKDKNSGRFSGIIYGDKLIGTYRFSSEGMVSYREIAFEIKDKNLVEGFGEVKESGNGFVFKDTATLRYDQAMPLVKDSCK